MSHEYQHQFQLMLRHGLIQGSVSGTFHLLPMTVRALKKLEWLIDTYMQGIGAQKFSATCLGSAQEWKKSGTFSRTYLLQPHLCVYACDKFQSDVRYSGACRQMAADGVRAF